MLVVAENQIAGLMTPEAAFDAIEAVFAAMARRKARNFPVIREDFCKAEALLQVQDTAELTAAIRGLLADAPRRTELGRRATRVVQDQAGALKATVEHLLPLIPS